MRKLLAACVAALTFAAPALSFSSPATLNDLASWLAMRQVSVQCLTPAEADFDLVILWGASAYVQGWFDTRGNWHPGKSATFGPGICEALSALQNGRAAKYSVSDLARAILIFTHEAGHLRGHRWSANESKTECWAVRHVGYVAARLGVTNPIARRMLVYEAVQRHLRLPSVYLSSPCQLPSTKEVIP